MAISNNLDTLFVAAFFLSHYFFVVFILICFSIIRQLTLMLMLMFIILVCLREFKYIFYLSIDCFRFFFLIFSPIVFISMFLFFLFFIQNFVCGANFTQCNLLMTEYEKMECPVCLQLCVHPSKLPCGHIFCFLCVKVCMLSIP